MAEKNIVFNTLVICLSLLFVHCNGGQEEAASGPSQPPPWPAISLSRVSGGFNQPLQISHAGDGSGRIFIAERGGKILIIENGTVKTIPFIDISDRVLANGGEQGLLGLAFSPDYRLNGQFFVNYTEKPDGNTIVSSFSVSSDPDLGDPAGESIRIMVDQPFANHNGGNIAFGPQGFLYIGLGDGGSGGDPLNNAQNPATFLGKILRIDVESGLFPYSIPPGNPFVGDPGTLDEIWATGLRNPWRFSFDRLTGDLYIADVGQSTFEELNFQPGLTGGGENYGWNIMEGPECFNAQSCQMAGLTLPVADYDHSFGDCSITGGYVYRGQAYPSLQGIYIYGDFCSGKIWGLRRAGTVWESSLLLDSTLQISTFGEDEAGNLYVADYGGGEIYMITAQ